MVALKDMREETERTAPVVDLSAGAGGVSDVRDGIVVRFILDMVQDGAEVLGGEIRVVGGQALTSCNVSDPKHKGFI